MIRRIMVSVVVLVVCASCVSSVGVSMNNDTQVTLRNLTIGTNHDNFYADVLRQTTDYVFEAVPSAVFNKHEFWRCLILDSGTEEHHFLIAVTRARDKASILTDSVVTFNQVFAEEELCLSDEDQATSVAMEALLLTRPYFKRFIVISSNEELRHYGDVSGLSVSPLHMYINGNGVYTGKTVILMGVDLVERIISLSQNTGVSFEDRVLVRQFAQPSSPHG